MTVGIYALYDSKNNQCLWVGQSINIEKRYARHLYLLKNKSHRKDFNQWFMSKECQEASISYRILEETGRTSLNEKEGYWFSKLSPLFYGQKPSTTRKWFLSDEVKERISISHKKRIREEKENRTYKSNWHSRSAEAQAKALEILKANSFTSEKVKESAKLRDKDYYNKTDEHKANISKKALLNAQNIFFCEECGKSCKGKSALGCHMKTHQ